MNALVWFWWIDETLSANIDYQSDYEIGRTTPSGEANEDHDMMMVMIKCLDLEKKKEKNKKLKAQRSQRLYSWGSLFKPHGWLKLTLLAICIDIATLWA